MKTQFTFLITSTCLSRMHQIVSKLVLELILNNENMVAHRFISGGQTIISNLSLCTMKIRVGLVNLRVQHTDGEKRNNFLLEKGAVSRYSVIPRSSTFFLTLYPDQYLFYLVGCTNGKHWRKKN